MAFKRGKGSISHGLYTAALNVMDAMGWTWEEYLAQPDDLIAELEIRISKSGLARKK